MITEKNIYRTLAYKQLKLWCDGDKAKLKILAKQFVDNRNNFYTGNGGNIKSTHDLMSAFFWFITPQGAPFWERIHYATIHRCA